MLSGPIFTFPSEVLLALIDNKIRSLQAEGMHSVSHNVLSKNDTINLFKSYSLSKKNPACFQTHMVFIIGLLTATRPSTLSNLSVKQFNKVKIGNYLVWKITHSMGSITGASKIQRGGLHQVDQKTSRICVFNDSYLREKLINI